MGIKNIIHSLKRTVVGHGDYHQATFGQRGRFVVGSSDPFYANINPTGDANQIVAQIDSIANVSGDTWRITFSNTADLSRVSKACTIKVSGATSDNNNGEYAVVGFNDGSNYVDVVNANGVAQATAAGSVIIYPPLQTSSVVFLGGSITIDSYDVEDEDGATFPTASVLSGFRDYGKINELTMSAGNAVIYYV